MVWDSREITEKLKVEFPNEKEDVLASIVSTEYQRRAKRNFRRLQQWKPEIYSEVMLKLEDIRKGKCRPTYDVVINMAKRNNLSPMQTMR